MQRPWVRALFTFLVSLIGLESITGIVWLFTTSDKLHEICLGAGILLSTWFAYLEHDRSTRDPMLMDREQQRALLRQFARDQRRETQRPP